jgi:ubiquitin-protein ligase
MIAFKCPSCQRAFSVPDGYAGRKAKCACGATIAVPTESQAIAAPASAAPQGLRQRRLLADEKSMRAAFGSGKGAIRLVDAIGSPPEKYVVEFLVRSLLDAETPLESHRAEVQLTSDYPRVGPACRMLTPVFHPNIDTSHICIGDHWAAGERLVDLVVRIGEMLAYQAYNIRSPLNAEAAMWADLNAAKLPTDARDLRATNPS